MPVVIHDFETLPAAGAGSQGAGSSAGSAPKSETAARVTAERAMRRIASRQKRLRG